MDKPPILGKLEQAVMDYLWQNGKGDVKEAYTIVGKPRRISLNTVQSTLKRLHLKGLLYRKKVSHAYTYSPAISRQEFHQKLIQDVVETHMKNEPELMLTAFVNVAEDVSPELLDRFEKLIAERSKKGTDS